LLFLLLLFKTHLEGFTAASQSVFGCLLVGNKVVVATERWWRLSSTELVLIQLLVSSLSDCTAQDIAVFLPHTSPEVRYFLLRIIMLYIDTFLLSGSVMAQVKV
jgi:protein fuzzy